MAEESAPATAETVRGHGRSSTLREVIDVQKSSTSPVTPVPVCVACAVLAEAERDALAWKLKRSESECAALNDDVSALRVENERLKAEADWLASECADLDWWAVENDRIGYVATGDAAAWIALAKQQTDQQEGKDG